MDLPCAIRARSHADASALPLPYVLEHLFYHDVTLRAVGLSSTSSKEKDAENGVRAPHGAEA